MDSRPAHPAPRSAFQPFAARPLTLPTSGLGLVELYLAPTGHEGDAAAAALAVLLRSAVGADRLLLEVSDRFRGATDVAALTRVSNARVWRAGVAASGGRRRDWVLALDECRASYATTLVALGGGDDRLQTQLSSLVDRTVVVSRAGQGELGQTHRLVRRLRDDGVRHCECLWLDAA